MKSKKKNKLSLNQVPFHRLVVEDQELVAIKKYHSDQSPDERRIAAQFVYDDGLASALFNRALPEAHQKDNNEYDSAVVAYAIDPLFAAACLTVASIEYLKGWKDEAFINMLKLSDMPDPDNDLPIIISRAVDFFNDQEEFQFSLNLLEKATKRFPNDADLYDSIGYVKFKLGYRDDAVAFIRKAVALDPKNPTLLSNLGWVLMETDAFAEAETVFNKALEIDPDHEWAIGNLQLLQEAMNKI